MLIKLKLLIFLVFRQYGLACKYRTVFQILNKTGYKIAFYDIWHNNSQSGKAITKSLFNLCFK